MNERKIVYYMEANQREMTNYQFVQFFKSYYKNDEIGTAFNLDFMGLLVPYFANRPHC